MGRVHISSEVLESDISIGSEELTERIQDVEIPPRDSGTTIYLTRPQVATALEEGRLGQLAVGMEAIVVGVRPGDQVDASMLQHAADETGAEVYVVLAQPEVMGQR